MNLSTRGLFAALLLLALGPVGCSPKYNAQNEPPAPEVQAATPTPVPSPARETLTTPQPVAERKMEPPQVAAPKPDAAALKSLRIVAWNLEWFPGHKPTATPEASAAHMAEAKVALAELKPDVLLLEEIRDWESAAELCTAVPGLEVHVTSAFQPRPQNQVVASRFTADSTWSESWQADTVAPPRGYSFAAVELPGHRFLLTYALHLKSNLGELGEDIAMREASMKQLLKHSQEMLAIYGQRGPCAVVIGGDMNTSLDDPKFKDDQTLPALIAAGYRWTFEGVPVGDRTTIPAKNGFADGCFDHIFTAGLGKTTAAPKPHPGLSDHYPVVLDVDLTQADFKPKLDPAPGIALLDKALAPMPSGPVTKLDAADTPGLVAANGQPVVVKGKVSKVGQTNTGSMNFINFAGVPRGGFVAIVKQDHLAAITAALGGDLSPMLEGKVVSVSGRVAIYKDAPQVIITAPSQIRVEK